MDAASISSSSVGIDSEGRLQANFTSLTRALAASIHQSSANYKDIDSSGHDGIHSHERRLQSLTSIARGICIDWDESYDPPSSSSASPSISDWNSLRFAAALYRLRSINQSEKADVLDSLLKRFQSSEWITHRPSTLMGSLAHYTSQQRKQFLGLPTPISFRLSSEGMQSILRVLIRLAGSIESSSLSPFGLEALRKIQYSVSVPSQQPMRPSLSSILSLSSSSAALSSSSSSALASMPPPQRPLSSFFLRDPEEFESFSSAFSEINYRLFADPSSLVSSSSSSESSRISPMIRNQLETKEEIDLQSLLSSTSITPSMDISKHLYPSESLSSSAPYSVTFSEDDAIPSSNIPPIAPPPPPPPAMLEQSHAPSSSNSFMFGAMSNASQGFGSLSSTDMMLSLPELPDLPDDFDFLSSNSIEDVFQQQLFASTPASSSLADLVSKPTHFSITEQAFRSRHVAEEATKAWEQSVPSHSHRLEEPPSVVSTPRIVEKIRFEGEEYEQPQQQHLGAQRLVSSVSAPDAAFHTAFSHFSSTRPSLRTSILVENESLLVRDCLAVLQGIPSFSFVLQENGLFSATKLRLISTSINSLHSILTDFAQMGTLFRRLDTFSATFSSNASLGGFLLQAFASGIGRYIQHIRDTLLALPLFVTEAHKKHKNEVTKALQAKKKEMHAPRANFFEDDLDLFDFGADSEEPTSQAQPQDDDSEAFASLTVLDLWLYTRPLHDELSFVTNLCGFSSAAQQQQQQQEPIKGVALLSHLEVQAEAASSGSLPTRQSSLILALFKRTFLIYARWLTSWIFKGHVDDDPYAEFFVDCSKSSPPLFFSSSSSSSGSSSSASHSSGSYPAFQHMNKEDGDSFWNNTFSLRTSGVAILVPRFMQPFIRPLFDAGRNLHLLRLFDPSHPAVILSEARLNESLSSLPIALSLSSVQNISKQMKIMAQVSRELVSSALIPSLRKKRIFNDPNDSDPEDSDPDEVEEEDAAASLRRLDSARDYAGPAGNPGAFAKLKKKEKSDVQFSVLSPKKMEERKKAIEREREMTRLREEAEEKRVKELEQQKRAYFMERQKEAEERMEAKRRAKEAKLEMERREMDEELNGMRQEEEEKKSLKAKALEEIYAEHADKMQKLEDRRKLAEWKLKRMRGGAAASLAAKEGEAEPEAAHQEEENQVERMQRIEKMKKAYENLEPPVGHHPAFEDKKEEEEEIIPQAVDDMDISMEDAAAVMEPLEDEEEEEEHIASMPAAASEPMVEVQPQQILPEVAASVDIPEVQQQQLVVAVEEKPEEKEQKEEQPQPQQKPNLLSQFHSRVSFMLSSSSSIIRSQPQLEEDEQEEDRWLSVPKTPQEQQISDHHRLLVFESSSDMPPHLALSTCLIQPALQHSTLLSHAAVSLFLGPTLRLQDHFSAIRRYILMQAGDFVDALLTQGFKSAASSSSPLAVKAALETALKVSGYDVDPLSENVDACIVDVAAERAARGLGPSQQQYFFAIAALDHVRLTYVVHWPLTIILHRAALDQYGRIFSFLLRVKRCVAALRDDLFVMLKDRRLKEAHAVADLRILELHLLRHEMQHFIATLEGYLVSRVIDASWTEFLDADRLQSVESVDQLRDCHHALLHQMTRGCLLLKRQVEVHRVVESLLSDILTFRAQVEANPPTQRLSGNALASFIGTRDRWAQHRNLLLMLLSRASALGGHPELEDLLMRLNYNGFFQRPSIGKG